VRRHRSLGPFSAAVDSSLEPGPGGPHSGLEGPSLRAAANIGLWVGCALQRSRRNPRSSGAAAWRQGWRRASGPRSAWRFFAFEGVSGRDLPGRASRGAVLVAAVSSSLNHPAVALAMSRYFACPAYECAPCWELPLLPRPRRLLASLDCPWALVSLLAQARSGRSTPAGTLDPWLPQCPRMG